MTMKIQLKMTLLLHVAVTMNILHLLSAYLCGCWTDCDCDGQAMTCNGGFGLPEILPKDIVTVKHRYLSIPGITPYGHESWTNLTELHLADVHPHLPDNYFILLKKLQALIILDSPYLYSMGLSSLSGLATLKELHFSNIGFIHINDISLALNGNGTVPNLEILVINNIHYSKKETSLYVNETFFSIVNHKTRLHTLKFTNLVISQMFISPQQLCKYRHLSFARSQIEILEWERPSESNGHAHLFNKSNCNYNQHLDISYTRLPHVQNDLNYKSIYSIYGKFPSSSTFVGLFAKLNIFKSTAYNYMNLRDSKVGTKITTERTDLQVLNNNTSLNPLKKLVCKGHNLYYLSLPLNFTEDAGHVGLEDLEISSSQLMYISPHLILPPNSLERMVLADNILNVMQNNYSIAFQIVFKKYSNLQHLDISYNKISKLPPSIFIGNTKLKHLDISNNVISAITFDFSHLVHLRYLGIHHNRIVTIGDQQMRNMDNLVYKIGEENEKYVHGKGKETSLLVDLGENLFECSFSNLETLHWIERSSFLQETGKKNKYVCKVGDSSLDIKTLGYKEIFNSNENYKMNSILFIKFLEIIIVAILEINRVQKRLQNKNKKHLKNFITMSRNNHNKRETNFNEALGAIRKGTFQKKFLVFLSHSSEDEQFVNNVIYPIMEQHLKQLTQMDTEHVCICDKHIKAGYNIENEIQRCINDSAIIVCVVSESFAQREWCKVEVKYVYDQNIPVILIMKGKVEQYVMSLTLRHIFNTFARIKCTFREGEYELTPCWDLLCRTIIELAGEKYLHLDKEHRLLK